jgi:hypothetical protein
VDFVVVPLDTFVNQPLGTVCVRFVIVSVRKDGLTVLPLGRTLRSRAWDSVSASFGQTLRQVRWPLTETLVTRGVVAMTREGETKNDIVRV